MTLSDGSHYDAQLAEHEAKMVRLWIETSATYPGTYASLGCGTYGVGQPHGELRKRCASCHDKELKNRKGEKYMELFFRGRSVHRPGPLCNLSHPEKSRLLRGPLAKEAGGLASCKEAVFGTKEDPLYQQMLAAIRDAHNRLNQGKRFDMPGFRPNEHYIREMQRFGFLPKDLKPDNPIDVYAVDRAYWDSFNCRVQTAGKN